MTERTWSCPSDDDWCRYTARASTRRRMVKLRWRHHQMHRRFRMHRDVYAATCQYGDGSRLVVRRAAYREVAVQQEGGKRSVYLTRPGAARLALVLLREAMRR